LGLDDIENPLGHPAEDQPGKCRSWSHDDFGHLAFLLAVLGALVLPVFLNQMGYIVLGDAKGFCFGLGNGMGSLPVLLGSDIEMDTVLVVRIWVLLVNTECYCSAQ
jgi:hypothetical protein